MMDIVAWLVVGTAIVALPFIMRAWWRRLTPGPFRVHPA
jgi:hypothetical protein